MRQLVTSKNVFIEAIADNHMNNIQQKLILLPTFFELHEYNSSFIWHAKEVGAVKTKNELTVLSPFFDHLENFLLDIFQDLSAGFHLLVGF